MICLGLYKYRQKSWDLNPGPSDSKPFAVNFKFLRAYKVHGEGTQEILNK